MPYLKHVFRYQEYRRTQFLNTMSKDDLGRHRGGVLYGMKLIPKIGNAIHVDAGALYTPYGTKIFWDVRADDLPSSGVVSLGDLTNTEGDSIWTDVTLRPHIIAVVAELPTDTDTGAQLPIESDSDLAGATPPVTFKAFVASYRQDTARPGFDLFAKHPVELGSPGGPGTWNPVDAGYSDQALRTVDPLVDPITAGAIRGEGAGSAKDAAVKFNQILIGYIIVGGIDGSTPNTVATVNDVWADGITYVPVMNPWQTLQSLLGFDPLMGRTAGLVDGGVADALDPNTGALSQSAVSRKMATGATGFSGAPLGVPRFGTPLATVAGFDPTWSTYRFPNFVRDGDSILETLRRMDYLLRLWMDKTGDQGLIRSAQDGVTGYLSRFSPLDALLYQMDGLDTVTNLNTANWGSDNDLPLNVSSDPFYVAVATVGAGTDIDNHVLKSGVMLHKPSLLDITAMQGAGDSHRQAIRALDWSMFHMLEDVLGVSFKRSYLRLEGPWSAGVMNDWADLPAGLPVDNTGEADVQSGFPLRPTIFVDGAGLPGMVAADFNVYLGTEKIKEAVEAVAKRSSQNAGPNLLKNSIFAKTGPVANPGSPLNWVVDAGTTWQIIPATGGDGTARRFNATLTGTTGRLHQTINLTSNPELLGAILDSGVLSISVSMAQLSAGVVYVGLKLSDVGSADLLAVGGYVKQTGASVSDGYTSFTFALKFPEMRDTAGAATAERGILMAAVKYLSIEVLNLDGAVKVVDIAGAHLGAGMPPLLPMANQDYYEFLSRDGGVDSAMRGPLEMGNQDINDVKDLTVNGFSNIETPVGGMIEFIGAAAPQRWLLCDGSVHVGAAYPLLYALLQSVPGDPFTQAPAGGCVEASFTDALGGGATPGDITGSSLVIGDITSRLAPGSRGYTDVPVIQVVNREGAPPSVQPTFSVTVSPVVLSGGTVTSGGEITAISILTGGSGIRTGAYIEIQNALLSSPLTPALQSLPAGYFRTPDSRGRFALGWGRENRIPGVVSPPYAGNSSGYVETNHVEGQVGGAQNTVGQHRHALLVHAAVGGSAWATPTYGPDQGVAVRTTSGGAYDEKYCLMPANGTPTDGVSGYSGGGVADPRPPYFVTTKIIRAA